MINEDEKRLIELQVTIQDERRELRSTDQYTDKKTGYYYWLVMVYEVEGRKIVTITAEGALLNSKFTKTSK